MNPTLEVRWFLPVEPPPRPDLFRSAPAPEIRTDWYAPANRSCGIKLRGGNLDVKLLEEDLGVREPAGCRGRLQRWRKWIFDGGSVPALPDHLLTSNEWIPVTKKRSLLVFEADRTGIHPASDWPTDWPETGCQFEWSEVTVNGPPVLTIGLESFGSPDTFEFSLMETAARVLPEILPGLPSSTDWEGSSRSYPDWLLTLD